ncbi:MAG TPA: vitamin K epoxide reductase family protein [Actinomycetota bacterium]|nr:vitamin K epoxide reductase family protein [Actinomycetota bacterium]
MIDTRIPADGPDMALYRMARKLRLRYSQAFVVRAIAAHPRPNSLLALVEVASTMGVKTTPARTDASGLPQLKLPAVVHFTDASGDGGFGVLEEVSPSRVLVWDSVNGRRQIERDDFLSRWTGVVVLMERAEEPGATEHRHLRQRLLEVVGGGTTTPALADGRAAPVLRSLLAAMIVTLLAAAVFVTPASERIATAVLVVLAGVGLAVTLLMAAAVGDRDNPLADRVCRRGRLLDCQSVLTSRFSRVFGLPLSDVGLAFYASILLLVASAGWLAPPAIGRVSTFAFTAALPFAVLLVALQVSMRQFCTLCMVTHLVNATAAAVGWFFLWDGRLGARDVLLTVLLGLFFVLAEFVVIPYFRRSISLALISDRYRRLSASPFASLAHIATQPVVDVHGSDSAVPVAGTAGEHEAVIFVHPGCGKCLPVLREFLAFVQAAPVNAFVGVAPKDPEEADRRACSVLAAAWMLTGPDRIVDGYASAKQNLPRLSQPDGLRLVAEALSIDPTQLERATSAARPLVQRAEQVVDDYSDGTPAIFFDSRHYAAPLAHLAFLIENHLELLEPK